MAPADPEAPRTLRESVHPRHTALVISDVQNDFCTPGGKIYDRAVKQPELVTTLISAVGAFARHARENGVPVIYVRNTHLARAVDVPPAHLRYLRKGGYSGNVEDVSCITGSWGHQVVDAIAPRAKDIVIDKASFNSLTTSMIDKVLHAQGIETVVLTGISTNSGILASSFGLLDHGYDFFIPRECVTAYDPELHDAAMKILRPYAVSAADVVEAWKAASAG